MWSGKHGSYRIGASDLRHQRCIHQFQVCLSLAYEVLCQEDLLHDLGQKDKVVIVCSENAHELKILKRPSNTLGLGITRHVSMPIPTNP